MRERFIVALVLIASAVLTLNHHLEVANMRASHSETCAHLRTVNSEAQGIAADAMELSKAEFERSQWLESDVDEIDTYADSLASANDALNNLIAEQAEYIDLLLYTLDVAGIDAPTPPMSPEDFREPAPEPPPPEVDPVEPDNVHKT